VELGEDYMTDKKDNKKIKKKGPIRYEAIIPVLIIFTLTFLYFSYYFDKHLKSLIEYAGTQANGAEVNVGDIDTSFIKASFDIHNLQVTNKERPTHNAIEIENIHFQYLWDALLRMKFVVEDASITNIQLAKPRKSIGKVLPPEPAKPSKINQIQDEVLAQVKNKYGANMLGNIIALLEGGDYKDQINQIRGELKSEARAQEMATAVKKQKESWDQKIKTLSDTTKLKAIEAQVQSISKEKGVLQQAQGVKKLNDLLKEVESQYKEIQLASNNLEKDIKDVTQFPKELESLINQDINSLKNRFSVPQLDFKDMAMHLFAGQFTEYIVKARKYHALAKQYIPEKKNKEEDEIIPPRRSEGETYLFPVTTGYPLFWLKRAAISSKGTADSYSGNISGELTNVTTAPKQIKKPAVLDLQGNFPASKIMGVNARFTVDHTKKIGKQMALLKVESFLVPEKMFVDQKNMKFGFLNAIGTSSISATMIENNIDMTWNAVLNKPNFVVESETKLAKEMLSNILQSIPQITIDGKVTGPFKKLKLKLNSNLGQELGEGLKRELGAKVADAQNQIRALVEEKVNGPKENLLKQIGGAKANLSQLNDVQAMYKKNENKIKEEIEKLKKGGSDNLKDQGKKLLKGIKF
jgi:uncharacterized protein (TIGR03545 family)